MLVDLKPVGDGYMEDFHAAGGMGALLRELRPLLHLDTIDVTGAHWPSVSTSRARLGRSQASSAPSTIRCRPSADWWR